MRQMTFKLDPDLYERFRERAEADKIHMSDVVRTCVGRYVDGDIRVLPPEDRVKFNAEGALQCKG